MERMHLTAAMPLLAINTCRRRKIWERLRRQHDEQGPVRLEGRKVTLTFSMVRLPPNRVMNSAGEATVKSLWRSIFRCSRPFFTRCRPDMLGLTGTQRSQAQQLLSTPRISSRVSCAKKLVASAYFPRKRHGPATATDSGVSLEASVTSGYWKEELIKEVKLRLYQHWQQGECNCCRKSNQSQSSVPFPRRRENARGPTLQFLIPPAALDEIPACQRKVFSRKSYFAFNSKVPHYMSSAHLNVAFKPITAKDNQSATYLTEAKREIEWGV